LPDVGLVKYLSKAGQTIQPAKANQVLIPDNRPMLDDSNSPAVTATDVAIPTLYIMGDSTVRNGYMQGIGWGEMFGEYFGPHKLNVLNKAIGGRSTRSFMREKRWEEIYKQLKPGDVVIMQFGHNDGGRVGDPRFKRRPSLPGIGDEIQEVTMEDGTVETVHSYGWYLKQFCNGAKEKGAVAIICSPVPHKDNWHDSKFEPDFQGHREWCQQIAEATGALSIDLTAVVGAKYQELGEAKVNTLFADARTHTNAAGAKVNAECVVAGLKSLESQPLNRFLSDSGQNVGGNGLVEESVSAHAE
jgi:lysophospholipase L1-like esterase